jgi:integrase/recombinase XerD
MTAANKYLARRKGFLAPSTYEENERKLRYLSKVFTQLRNEGRVSTTFPGSMTREDVQEFLLWMRSQELDSETQAKYLYLVNKLTLFCKNPVIQEMKDEGEKLPGKTKKDLRSIDETDLRRIQQAAERISGWRGSVARFLVWIYPYTGVRPSELRLARLEDLDTKSWTFYVRHPKGEGSYGTKRTVPILPPARPAVERFLREREQYLRARNMRSEALVPNTDKGRKDDFFSSNAFRVIKAMVEKEAGVEFRLKDFRPTYAQMNLDRNPNLLSDVSKFLGHATTKTTEEHYGRIRDRTAFRRLEQTWSQEPVPEPAPDKKSVIRIQEYNTGYS